MSEPWDLDLYDLEERKRWQLEDEGRGRVKGRASTPTAEPQPARCINGDGRPMYDRCRCLCCRPCHRLLCTEDCCA